MAISSIGSSSGVSPSANEKTASKTTSSETVQSGQPSETPITSAAEESRQISRKKQNVALLEAHQSVSLSIQHRPLSLAYQAVIDALNEQLAPELGEAAIQRGQEQGLDVSPEATAERIVSLSTGLFSRFQEHRPELESSTQVDRFIELISSGIDQGFAEAREVLDGLNVLEGDIATNIDQTYTLVQEGLQAFADEIKNRAASADQSRTVSTEVSPSGNN